MKTFIATILVIVVFYVLSKIGDWLDKVIK